MCPDKQILSALYDGEIPEPWEGRIKEHLTECSKCSDQIAAYNKLSYVMDEDNPDFSESHERVWTKLALSKDTQVIPIWRRRISVPAPLLAAAAVVVFLGAGFFVGINRNAAPDTVSPEVWTVQFDEHELEELAELLKSRDDQVQVFIELPANSTFINPDQAPQEPQLLRAADYRR